MRIGVGTPARGIPGSGPRFVVSALTAEPWVTVRADGQQSERLVSSWSWNPEKTLLRLKLRTDVFFHDGTQLDSRVATEILKSSMKEAGAPLSYLSIASITASAPDTVDISLSSRNAFLLSDLALSSVRLKGPDNSPGPGTGPFRVVSADEEKTTLQAFPRYYRGQPALNDIVVHNYATQRNAWAALMRGEIDMLHEVSRDALQFVQAESTVKTYPFARSYFIPLVFNLRHGALANVKVRQALSKAVDKATLVREGMRGQGRPADGPIWPEFWAYSAPANVYTYDPVAARAQLDQAGFPLRARTDGGMPNRLSFTCLVFAEDSRFERLALLVQRQLADVDVEMKLIPVGAKELGERAARGDFDAFIFEMAGRSLSWAYEFWHSRGSGMLSTGYNAADATLDRIRDARTDDEIRAGLASLNQVMYDDPPAVFLTWQRMARAVSTRFDVGSEPDRDILTNVWQWRPAGPQVQAAR